jgi:hypothetical protein
MRWLCVIFGLAACTALPTASEELFAPCPAGGDATAGPPETHCGAQVVRIDPAQCHPTPGEAVPPPSPPAPMREAREADDDDCKLHVAWTTEGLCVDGGVLLQLIATEKATGTPARDAHPFVDGYLIDQPTIAIDVSQQGSLETAPGMYRIGPIRFPAPGRWVVRFHMYDTCHASQASPRAVLPFFADLH